VLRELPLKLPLAKVGVTKETLTAAFALEEKNITNASKASAKNVFLPFKARATIFSSSEIQVVTLTPLGWFQLN
jgi:hypothetical protein